MIPVLAETYSRKLFLELAESFLTDMRRDTRTVSNVSSNFAEVTSLGSSLQLDLQLFEVKVSGSLDKRVAIASDAFKLMKHTASYRSLVAFYSEDTDEWRLSLLTAKPILDNGKVVTKLSSPRRFSYLLGPGSKLTTPFKQLIAKGKVKDFDDLSNRFAVEVVNDEFYRGISKLYDELVGTDAVPALLHYPSDGESSHEFAVRLIGRIIFCWFLREKRSSLGTPLIPSEILSRRAADQTSYYNSLLAPLFFEVLNKPIIHREAPFQQDHFASIPYLNGGLFSPDIDDYYKFDKTSQTSIPGLVGVPDEWLRKFFDLLELYNFTVDENTSYDIDLSIDPEMLGRIFENLLARINPETEETVRNSTGSFYTPREIVEYMVDQSLKVYLVNSTSLTEDKISFLMSRDLVDDVSYELNTDERHEIIDALNSVRILDPACGSGAFPIGILQKIVFLLQQVDPDSKQWLQKQLAGAGSELRHHLEQEFQNRNFDYLRKLGVIRESIYGVDIQPIATEISRLRCFLTLIVDQSVQDEAPNRGVEPLPNLDFKFVTANSLIKLENESSNRAQQTGLFEDVSGINELMELRNEYFGSHNSEKERLKLRFAQSQNQMLQRMIAQNSHGYAELTRKLSTWDPFSHKATDWFNSKWMFGVTEGFDVVIANPPYGVSIKGDLRINIENSLGKVPDYEIYYYFIEVAKTLLASNGVMTYIIPNTILFNVYANKYRISMLEQWVILEILDCTAFPLFSEATVRNIILSAQKNRRINFPVGYRNTLGATSFAELVSRDEEYINSEDLKKNNTNWGLTFKLPRENVDIVSKLKSSKHVIKDLFPEISQGLIAYDKYRGQSKETIKSRAFHYSEKSKSSLKEWLWGQDVTPYHVKWNGKEYIDYCSEIANPREPKFFLGERVLVREITNPKIFTGFTKEEMYHDPALIVILNNENDILPLVGILNSRLATFYHFNSSPKATKGAFPKILVNDLKEFPIPDWNAAKELSPLVSEILKLKNSSELHDTTHLESMVDRMVYELYGLTADDIKIVESN